MEGQNRDNQIASEIEKLKVRRMEATNKMNLAISFDDKEDYRAEIARINEQIEVLEKFNK